MGAVTTGPRTEAPAGSDPRLAALFDAVVAVGSDLDLPSVLRRIVEAGCALVDARYGALGVLGEDGRDLVEFVTHGLTDEQRAAIGPEPHGRGLLGLVIRSPGPHRVARIAAHPDSHGFPANHPAMTSFLGAPVRVRDEVYGNLYLTDKMGADEFTEDDEAAISALASAAGVAIDNARLYQRSRDRQEWAEVARVLVESLLRGRPEQEVLADLARETLRLTGAARTTVATPAGTDLVVAASTGSDARTVGDVVDDPRWRRVVVPGPAPATPHDRDLLVRLGLEDRVLGVLALEDVPRGATSRELPVAELARRLSEGLTAASAQRERARLDVLEDRDRIARDMHDHIVQRLFATGLSLQSTARRIEDPDARERVDHAVDEVDGVIRDLRTTIFGLHHQKATRSLRSRLSDLVDGAAVTLGFAPTLTVAGDLTTVGPDVAEDLLAVVREGLSNAARHAGAGRVDVLVRVGEEVRVVIGDDGRGLPDGVVRSGLDNLGHRAGTRGGRLTVSAGDLGGTELVWVVPHQPTGRSTP